MDKAYERNIVEEATENVYASISSAQEMTERTLRMRSLAYLARIKAELLTETIYDVDRSRRSEREKNSLLAKQQNIIEEQNRKLERLNEELEERVRQEVEKSLAKDQILFQQSKMADMGEMLGMIAHQWRQPLSVISMGANNLLIDIELDAISATSVKEQADAILQQTKHLSATIDDFRNFFRPEREKELASVEKVIDSTRMIILSTLMRYTISLKIKESSSTKIRIYKNELMQVLINIINNAKDALIASKREDKVITVDVVETESSVNIDIGDNGGGIEKSIMEKMFDPYFTTKDLASGTGLGLYMSKQIIEKHLCGSIKASNRDDGVCFTITLPKDT